MKLTNLLPLLIFSSCATHTAHIDLMAGAVDYNSRNSWQQTDQQAALGIQGLYISPDGFGPEMTLMAANGTTPDPKYVNRSVNYTTSRTESLAAGVRKNFMLGKHFQAFASGGLEATMLRTTAALSYADPRSDRSVAFSPYLQGGVNYLFDKHYECGILYRHTFWGSTEEIFVTSPSTDSNLVMLTVGYSF